MKTILNVLLALPRLMKDALTTCILHGQTQAAASLRRRLYGQAGRIEPAVVVTHPGNLKTSEDTTLHHGCHILNPNGRVELGRNTHLGAYCHVNACRGTVSVGNDVAIGPGTTLIAYSNHYEQGKKVTDVRRTEDITIGNNVFIGAQCTILPGTTIDDHVVLGAGSVAKGSLTSNCIYAGAPATVIREGWYA